MNDKKPHLFQYLKAQLNERYKLCGVIEDRKYGGSLAEANFARNKIVIDLILLIFSFIIIVYASSFFIVDIIARMSNALHNNPEYDPNTGWKFMFLIILTYSGLMLISHVAVPALMKSLRIMFGLRWHFVSFKAVQPDDSNNLPSKLKYSELYNILIAYECDQISLKRTDRAAGLKYEVLKRFSISRSEALLIKLYHFLMSSIYFILPFVALFPFLEINSTEVIKIIFLSFILLLYFLSHLFAYFYWNKRAGIHG